MKIAKALAASELLWPLGLCPRGRSRFASTRICRGNYAFTMTGQILAGPQAGTVTGVAMTNFDGQGYLSQVDHVVHNRASPALAWRPGTGSHTVNLDCTGTVVINFTDGSPPLQLYFVLTKLGAEIRIVVINAGTNKTSVGVRRN